MFRTEEVFFAAHRVTLLRGLNSRVAEIEDADELDAEDEMELAALDRLIVLLEEA